MLASALERCRKGKDILSSRSCRHERCHAGLALRDRACLVEDDRIEVSCALERFCALDQDADLGATLRADHDGGRSGKAQSAGAGDDKDRDGVVEGSSEVSGCQEREPEEEGRRSNGHNDGDEDAGDAVSRALDRSLRVRGLIDELDDVG